MASIALIPITASLPNPTSQSSTRRNKQLTTWTISLSRHCLPAGCSRHRDHQARVYLISAYSSVGVPMLVKRSNTLQVQPESSPASSVSATTHDTSRTKYHIDELGTFAQRLEEASLPRNSNYQSNDTRLLPKSSPTRAGLATRMSRSCFSDGKKILWASSMS